MTIRILFFKAIQHALFDAPIMVPGHTRASGTFVAPYASHRKKRLDPPKTRDLFGATAQHPARAHAAATARPELTLQPATPARPPAQRIKERMEELFAEPKEKTEAKKPEAKPKAPAQPTPVSEGIGIEKRFGPVDETLVQHWESALKGQRREKDPQAVITATQKQLQTQIAQRETLQAASDQALRESNTRPDGRPRQTAHVKLIQRSKELADQAGQVLREIQDTRAFIVATERRYGLTPPPAPAQPAKASTGGSGGSGGSGNGGSGSGGGDGTGEGPPRSFQVTVTRKGKEVRFDIEDAFFTWLQIAPHAIWADIDRLQIKHPEYFSSPDAVQQHIHNVLAEAEIAMPATHPAYTLLVTLRENADHQAATVEFVLRGGKYRVRNAQKMPQSQLDVKLNRAGNTVRVRRGSRDSTVPPRTAEPTAISARSPVPPSDGPPAKPNITIPPPTPPAQPAQEVPAPAPAIQPQVRLKRADLKQFTARGARSSGISGGVAFGGAAQDPHQALGLALRQAVGRGKDQYVIPTALGLQGTGDTRPPTSGMGSTVYLATASGELWEGNWGPKRAEDWTPGQAITFKPTTFLMQVTDLALPPKPSAPSTLSEPKISQLTTAQKAAIKIIDQQCQGDVWQLAGPRHRELRRDLHQRLLEGTGEKATVANSGVNAIENRLMKLAGIPTQGKTISQWQRELAAWMKEAVAPPPVPVPPASSTPPEPPFQPRTYRIKPAADLAVALQNGDLQRAWKVLKPLSHEQLNQVLIYAGFSLPYAKTKAELLAAIQSPLLAAAKARKDGFDMRETQKAFPADAHILFFKAA